MTIHSWGARGDNFHRSFYLFAYHSAMDSVGLLYLIQANGFRPVIWDLTMDDICNMQFALGRCNQKQASKHTKIVPQLCYRHLVLLALGSVCLPPAPLFCTWLWLRYLTALDEKKNPHASCRPGLKCPRGRQYSSSLNVQNTAAHISRHFGWTSSYCQNKPLQKNQKKSPTLETTTIWLCTRHLFHLISWKWLGQREAR